MSPPSPALTVAATRRLSTPTSSSSSSTGGSRGSPSSGGGGAVSKKRRSLNGGRSSLSHQQQQQQQQYVQMNLDFGQTKLGMATCTDCGMVYSAGNQTDFLRHAKFHASAAPSPKSGSWRGQQAVKEFFNGDRIVRVTPVDRIGWQRAKETFQLMDQELGKGTEPETYGGMLVLLYVRHKVGIIGCCIAEAITEAYRLLPPPPGADSAPQERSPESQAAQCGIHKVWCHSGHRRSRVATAMMDAARDSLFLGMQVPLDRVAFTGPTPSGYRLACRYTGTDRPLVY